MTAYTPPPTGVQFHDAYWRTGDELTRARARAVQAAAEQARAERPTGETTGREGAQ